MPDYTINQPNAPGIPITFHNFTVPTAATKLDNPLTSNSVSVGGFPHAVAVSKRVNSTGNGYDDNGDTVYVVSRAAKVDQPGTLFVIDPTSLAVIATVSLDNASSTLAVNPKTPLVYRQFGRPHDHSGGHLQKRQSDQDPGCLPA